MISVIADDITGAAEIAGVCLRYGLNVSFGIDLVPNETSDVRIIATNSRSLTEREAYNTHLKLAAAIYSNPDSLVYKKCDSVLRGYVLTELSALLEVSKQKTVLLQPANPATGRCINDGVYFINNEKIENTGFATDPDFPATDSSIQNLLLQRSGKHDNIIEVHSGKITNIGKSGVFIPNCLSIKELRSCTELATKDTMLCGGAAFFEQILIQKSFATKNIVESNAVSINNNFLLVSGSFHPESARFANYLLQIGCPVVSFPEAFLKQDIDNTKFNEWLNDLSKQWTKNKMMSVSISEHKIDFPGSAEILKQRLNKVVGHLLADCDINELLIEGGATTYSVLESLGWDTLTPIAELAPGVIRLEVPIEKNLFLTIKPGSYTWPSDLISKI